MHQRRANLKKIPQEVLKQNKKARRLERIYIVLVIALCLSIFALVSAATDRFGLRADLTSNRLYELTEETKNILSSLDTPVTLTYCGSKQNGDSNITEVISRYAAASDLITEKYIDLEANPAFCDEYAAKGITLFADGVLVSCRGRDEFTPWEELYSYVSTTDSAGNQSNSVSGLMAETRITASIVKLLSAKTPVIAFTAGHSEYVPQGLKNLYINGNYEVKQLVLGLDDINSASSVIIAGPGKDFSAAEIKLLTDYMNAGGNLAVFLDPEKESLPNLEAFLLEYGLAQGSRFVLEPSRQMDSPLNIIPNFGLSMLNVYFSEAQSYLVMPVCRELKLSSPNGWITSAVLKSTSDSYGKEFGEMNGLSRSKNDASGPFTVAALSERTLKNGSGNEKTQYVFLASCVKFYDDTYIATESIANADFMLQLMSYMNDSGVSVNIPAKSLAVPSISISRGAVTAFAAVFVVIIPAALLIYGIWVFLKRRHS